MQLTSDERRRARFRKVLRLLRHPVTWKVIVMVAQALAWLWDRMYPPR